MLMNFYYPFLRVAILKMAESITSNHGKETSFLFDFEEQSCNATIITKDKVLKMPSSFLCYVSKTFKDELEKQSNILVDTSFESGVVICVLSYFKPAVFKNAHFIDGMLIQKHIH